MIELGLEPEPLAFRVRPQAEECFDSWIDRVAFAHETTRSALFRHLAVDEALARQDLVRGRTGLGLAGELRVDQLVERLAWAVQAEPEQIARTFLEVDGAALLPRRSRRYVCAHCWQQARREGRTPIVRKEWILRMSWRCRLHDVPLSRAPAGPMVDRAVDAWLGAALAEAESLRGGLGYRGRLIAWNAECLDALLRGSRKRFAGAKLGYRERFQSNLFHFARDRVAMLALAHSRADRAVWGFERLVTIALPERPGRSAASLQPPRRPRRGWRIGQGRARRGGVEADLSDLLRAYLALRERREPRARLRAEPGRFAAFGPEGGAVKAAPTPIW